MRTLLIDNYDSFTFNLFQYLRELKGNPIVKKNDAITLDDINLIHPTHIIISPGPGTVEKEKDFGICLNVIKQFGPKIPLLGVCLGHQGIAYAFGGEIIHAPEILHGKQSTIEHKNSKFFLGIPKKFTVMRYHSLAVNPKTLPKDLKITAWEKEQKTIMALEHLTYPIFGVQFHPESFQTEYGKHILKNFLLT